MFSKLSKGYGSWNAGFVDPYFGERKRESSLPDIDHESHCHGVTVGPHSGRSTAMSWATNKYSREPTNDSLPLPKTLTTRRGALQIYVAPEDADGDDEEENEGLALKAPYVQKRPSGQELIDLSLKLGTMDRLVMSVLQFGDQDYEPEHTSVSDAKNKAFLKFLHSVDDGVVRKSSTPATTTVQPGGDLNTYLRELRSSSSMRHYGDGSTYIPKSRESVELQAILRGLDVGWPLSFPQDGTSDRQTPGQFTRPVSRISSSRGPSPRPPSTPRSTYQVLSSKKLTASLKSGSYLGRPSSALADDDTDSEVNLPAPVTSATVTKQQWSPSDSQDENLLMLRDQFYHGTEEVGQENEENKKRRRKKERSFLTGSDLLYQGRTTYQVEGSHIADVKVTGKGDGHSSEGRGHSVLEAVEEMGEGKFSGSSHQEQDLDDTKSADWNEAVNRISSGSAPDSNSSIGPQIKVETVADDNVDRLSCRSRSRPGSHSSVSSLSSKPTPTIISIQVSDPTKAPVKSQDKPFYGLNRRKSQPNTLHNSEKARLVHPQPPPHHRRKSLQPHRDHFLETHAGDTRLEEQNTRSYTFGPGLMSWSCGDEETGKEADMIPPDNTPDLSREQAHLDTDIADHFEEENQTAEARPDSGHSDDASVDEYNNVTDNGPEEQEDFVKEEDILDNIQECNQEVEEIEAKGEQIADDSSSDSGTYVDEEDMLKVIREVEKEQGLDLGYRADTRVSGVTMEMVTDEGQGDNEEVEVGWVENHNKPVDEVLDEVQSSVISRRSSRISISKKTKDGETDLGDVDDEAVMPALLSDQLITGEGHVSAGSVTPPEAAVSDTPADGEEHLQGNLEHSIDIDTNQIGASYNSTSNSRRQSLVESRRQSLVESRRQSLVESRRQSVVESRRQSLVESRRQSVVESRRQSLVESVPKLPDQTDGNNVPELNTEIAQCTANENILPVESHTPEELTRNEMKVVIETKSEVTVDQVVGNTDAPEVPADIDADTLEPEPAIKPAPQESLLVVDTDAKTKGRVTKKEKKERKPAGQVSRAGKGLAKLDEKATTESELDTERGVEAAGEAAAVGDRAGTDQGETNGTVDLQASSLEQTGDGTEVVEDDNANIPLQVSTAKDAHSIVSELDALGLRQPAKSVKKKTKKEKQGSKYVPPPPPSRKVEAPKDEAKIPDHLQELLGRQPTASAENLERDLERRGFLKDGKVTDLVDQSLSGPTLEAVGEGLTEEELELAKLILQQKIDNAKGKIDGSEGRASTAASKKKAPAKGAKGGKGAKKKKGVEEKSEEEIEREMIREKHDMEKQNRDKEAAELQRKIAERKKMLQMHENMAEEKQKEIREKMEQLEREADDLQRAEDEARDILAEVRKKQREEREARRRADLERKRNEANERRERERKEMEDKRKKESEMLEKIADAEMRRRLREEEERKAYEAERLAQEKYEEELREAQRQEEEEEERLKEMERQAEEEAMQRLIEEREAAERQRRRLMEEEEAMKEAEQQKMMIMMEEEKKLEDQRLKMEAEENAKRDAERQRLMELRRLEEEARMKMQEEIEKRRSEALARRDYNIESKQNVDKLRHHQGITRAWTFSYFVQWPRESYESGSRKSIKTGRPMGGPDPRKAVIKNPPPRKVVEASPDEATPASAT